jgi:hypothetical protein
MSINIRLFQLNTYGYFQFLLILLGIAIDKPDHHMEMVLIDNVMLQSMRDVVSASILNLELNSSMIFL